MLISRVPGKEGVVLYSPCWCLFPSGVNTKDGGGGQFWASPLWSQAQAACRARLVCVVRWWHPNNWTQLRIPHTEKKVSPGTWGFHLRPPRAMCARAQCWPLVSMALGEAELGWNDELVLISNGSVLPHSKHIRENKLLLSPFLWTKKYENHSQMTGQRLSPPIGAVNAFEGETCVLPVSCLVDGIKQKRKDGQFGSFSSWG